MENEHIYKWKINFPTKIDCRIKCHLETEMKKLFESRKVYASGSALPTLYVRDHIHKSTVHSVWANTTRQEL